ncbi:MAG TPA: hypothetical protein DCP63_03530, partial [Bacteroidetes bacterium]|nr:hypothetical protein [Bacteroidota bacterium]
MSKKANTGPSQLQHFSNIPRGWKETSIGDIGGGGQYGLNAAAMTEGIGIRFIRITDIDGEGQLGRCPPAFVPESAPKNNEYELKEGDILIARSGATAGKSYIHRATKEKCVFAGYLIRYKIDPGKALPAFVFRFLQTKEYWKQLRTHKRAVAQPNVNAKQLASIRFPLPPLPKQERIVAILDAAEDLRRLREQADQRMADLIPGLFHEMFGNPESTRFMAKPLVELVDPQRPVTYGILKPGPNVPEGVPYVRVVDIKQGRLHVAQLLRTRQEIASQYRRSTLSPGDLLVTIRGTVGRTCIVPGELTGANITQDTARLAPTPEVNAVYLMEFLNSSWAQNWMTHHMCGQAVKGINLGDLKKIPVLIPKVSLQNDFTAH